MERENSILIQKINILRNAGLNFEEIYKKLEIDSMTMLRLLKSEANKQSIRMSESKEKVSRYDRRGKGRLFRDDEKRSLIDKCIKLRLKGMTFKEIGDEIKVSYSTAYTWLKDENCEVEIEFKRKKKAEFFRKKNIAIELRKQGYSFEEIGKKFEITGEAVKYWLKDEPFEIERKEKYREENKNIAIELRISGLFFSEISRILNVSPSTIRHWLRDEPFEKERIKIKNKVMKFTKFEKSELIKRGLELRSQNLTFSKISKILGISYSTIRSWIIQYSDDERLNVIARNSFKRGEKKKMIERILHLRSCGLSFKEIEEDVGIKWKTLYNMLRYRN